MTGVLSAAGKEGSERDGVTSRPTVLLSESSSVLLMSKVDGVVGASLEETGGVETE